MFKSGMRPVHPGEILKEEFLDPLNLTPHRLAKAINVKPSRVNDIVLQRRGITADTAIRLARYFGTTEQFWLNLQVEFELRTTQLEKGSQIEQEITPMNVQIAEAA